MSAYRPDDVSSSDASIITKNDADVEIRGDDQPELQHRLFTWLLPNKDVPHIPLESERTPFPMYRSNPLSRMFMFWLTPLLSVGYKRTMTEKDLWKLDEDMSIKTTYPRFEKHLQQIISKHKRDNPDSTEWPKHAVNLALIRTFKYDLVLSVVLKCISSAVDTLTPLLTKHLIENVQQRASGIPSATVGKGIGYAIGITVMLMANSFLFNHAFVHSALVGVHARTILTKSLLDKSLRANAETRHKFPSGTILSFLGADVQRLEFLYMVSVVFTGLPIAIIIGVVVLIVNLKVSALVGIAVFFIVTAGTLLPSRFMSKYRVEANKFTDKRVALMRQILQAMRMIKFYAWEDAYEKLAVKIRNGEMTYVYKIQTAYAVVFGTYVGSTCIVSMSAFLTSYAIDGVASAAVIFSSLSLFSLLSMQVSESAFGIPMLIDGMHGGNRIGEYLQAPEESESTQEFYDTPEVSDFSTALEIKDASFYWDEFEEVESEAVEKKSKKSNSTKTSEKQVLTTHKTVLRDVTLSVDKGEFVVITGLTGSGKSSLLSAMAGLISKSHGSITVNGSLLLCGAPFVLNATIKDNILFEEQYDSRKYNEVVRACALDRDLDILQAGDMTEVGERGTTLSGGQKARVNLARAVYNERDIYLFDDVISAVDSNVGKHIVEKCLLEYLQGKTRVLATHNLAVVQKADRVIFINDDGTVDAGTESELLERNTQFSALMTHKNEVVEKPKDWALDQIDTDVPQDGHNANLTKRALGDGLLVEDEERAVNSLPFSVYWKYIKAGQGFFGPLLVPVIICSMALATFVSLFTNVWLSFWIEHKFSSFSNGVYIGIYVMFTALILVFAFIESGLLGYAFSQASKVLNLKALHRVIHTPMSFMDSTPIGRVLNRFTKDTNSLDNELGQQLKILLYLCSECIGILILAVIYVPWFAISIPFFIFGFLSLANYFQATSREVKRLEAINRSFVLNNFNEVLNGLETIKAYGAQTIFKTKNERLSDAMNEVSFVVCVNQRWINLALNLMASIAVLIVTLLSAIGIFDLTPGAAGLLTSYMIQFAGLISGILMTYTQAENEMNSVERTTHYAFELIQEAKYTRNDTQPPPMWPDRGTIKFCKVSLRYKAGLPLVLKNLSLDIGAHEKIGICGRTGAGKSSLMSALFRITEVEEGSIVIDDVDISSLGLRQLRSKLSIIPQDPVLFQGTVRSNLDPFGEKDDTELWEALRRGGLVHDVELAQSSGDAKVQKFHLDALVEDDGANFSLGERQLIALTRALVRRSKVLVMDEATSSVDYETDRLVQKTIAREFKECTILCIAHRLKTILKYDRVLVLEKGELEEFDEPHRLFSKGGRFREMCASAGITERDFA